SRGTPRDLLLLGKGEACGLRGDAPRRRGRRPEVGADPRAARAGGGPSSPRRAPRDRVPQGVLRPPALSPWLLPPLPAGAQGPALVPAGPRARSSPMAGPEISRRDVLLLGASVLVARSPGPSSRPGVRNAHVLVHDPVRRRLVLFGGADA